MELNVDFVFNLAKQINASFTKKHIATILRYDPSVMSRKGNLDPNLLYSSLFDFDNENSAVHGQDKVNIFKIIKVYCKNAKFGSVLKDIWDDDYKDFMVNLITVAAMELPKEKSKYNTDAQLKPDCSTSISKNADTSEQAITLIKQAMQDYNVNNMINARPFEDINYHKEINEMRVQVDKFIDIINTILLSNDSYPKENFSVYNIQKFCVLTREYFDYLAKWFPHKTHYGFTEDTKYQYSFMVNELNERRSNIASIYQKITGELFLNISENEGTDCKNV
ncbi:MAG: hypothetical protein LBR68_08015 [Lachnoclostridium sp.]|jgi:hypothetical protein|nr:hypothetical protein [Lachnoclostridium sp.]